MTDVSEQAISVEVLWHRDSPVNSFVFHYSVERLALYFFASVHNLGFARVNRPEVDLLVSIYIVVSALVNVIFDDYLRKETDFEIIHEGERNLACI